MVCVVCVCVDGGEGAAASPGGGAGEGGAVYGADGEDTAMRVPPGRHITIGMVGHPNVGKSSVIK